MPLKIAVIGCGRISSKHIDAISDNIGKLTPVAVCDTVVERAVKRQYELCKRIDSGDIKQYQDYRKMLEIEKPDIVTIATESGYHPAIAIDVLKSGGNVIVEKPMALSVKDAEMMIAAAGRYNKKLGVCFQNRFNAPVWNSYEALKKGRFGKMLHGMVQIRWNRNEAYYKEAVWRGTWEFDGGTLMNQCTHGIDLLQWFLGGNIKRVHGVLRRYLRPIEAEDFGAAIVEFENGAVGIIEGTADVYPKNLNETLSLFGEKGTVVIGGLAVNKLETWRFEDCDKIGDIEEKVVNPLEKDPPSVYGFGHSALFADFIDAVKNNREPLVNGEEGKKTVGLILAIYKSMKEGRPVDYPVDFNTMSMKGIFQ
jgi:predicted dehydrogenase